jgi:hypothetical protein
MEDLIVEAAGDQDVDLCVSHLANPDRAGDLAAARLGDRLAITSTAGRSGGELGAVLGARRTGHGRRVRRPRLG